MTIVPISRVISSALLVAVSACAILSACKSAVSSHEGRDLVDVNEILSDAAKYDQQEISVRGAIFRSATGDLTLIDCDKDPLQTTGRNSIHVMDIQNALPEIPYSDHLESGPCSIYTGEFRAYSNEFAVMGGMSLVGRMKVHSYQAIR